MRLNGNDDAPAGLRLFLGDSVRSGMSSSHPVSGPERGHGLKDPRITPRGDAWLEGGRDSFREGPRELRAWTDSWRVRP